MKIKQLDKKSIIPDSIFCLFLLGILLSRYRTDELAFPLILGVVVFLSYLLLKLFVSHLTQSVIILNLMDYVLYITWVVVLVLYPKVLFCWAVGVGIAIYGIFENFVDFKNANTNK